MLTSRFRIFMDEQGGDGGAGGTGSGDQTQGQSGAQANPASTQAQGDSRYDEYGYEKATSEPDAQSTSAATTETGKTSSDETDTKEPLKEAVLGYDEKDVEIPADPKPAPKPEIPLKFAVEVDTKGLINADLADLKEISEKHGLTKEQTQALIDMREKEVSDYKTYVEKTKTDHEKAVALERQQWTKELKEDKDLGGQNYTRTLRRVDKVLTDFFPGTKKLLTDRKMMLPPSVMRDLAKFYEQQTVTPKLVQGEPLKAQENPDDPLAFYK